MSRLPRLKGKELIRVLQRAGFEVTRIRAAAVPVHAGEIVGPGVLRAILRDIEMSMDELQEFL